MYQQRVGPEPETLEVRAAWMPRVVSEEGSIAVSSEPADRYAVVDEIIGGDVRLAVSAWPGVDEAGRLHFGSGSEPFEYDRAALQEEVDAHREREGQAIRPLRIGDAFLIRGFGPLGTWARVLDITASSRRAAKRAGLRAVAQPEAGEAARARVPMADAEAGEGEQPAWRRPPAGAGAAEDIAPPTEPSPGSVANAAV